MAKIDLGKNIRNPQTVVATAEAFKKLSGDKLTGDICAELADLLEVIRALAVSYGCSIEELERIRVEKAKERGGFEKRILLKEVID